MAKRGNGEGSVRKIGNKYVAKIQIGWLPNGHPRVKSFSADTYNGAVKCANIYQNAKKDRQISICRSQRG